MRKKIIIILFIFFLVVILSFWVWRFYFLKEKEKTIKEFIESTLREYPGFTYDQDELSHWFFPGYGAIDIRKIVPEYFCFEVPKSKIKLFPKIKSACLAPSWIRGAKLKSLKEVFSLNSKFLEYFLKNNFVIQKQEIFEDVGYIYLRNKNENLEVILVWLPKLMPSPPKKLTYYGVLFESFNELNLKRNEIERIEKYLLNKHKEEPSIEIQIFKIIPENRIIWIYAEVNGFYAHLLKLNQNKIEEVLDSDRLYILGSFATETPLEGVLHCSELERKKIPKEMYYFIFRKEKCILSPPEDVFSLEKVDYVINKNKVKMEDGRIYEITYKKY